MLGTRGRNVGNQILVVLETELGELFRCMQLLKDLELEKKRFGARNKNILNRK